jgi:steroid delta-isomerase-like uncharacterized protein
MSEENKALVRRWTEEIWNQGSMTAIDELVAADYIHHDPLMPDIQGRDALKQFVAAHREAIPDGRFTEDDLIDGGEKIVTRWTFRGTQKAEWLGVAATNSPVEVTGTTTLRLVQGRVAEFWAYWDSLGWMRRVGTVSAALIQRWIEEIVNKGNLGVVDEIFAGDAAFAATLIPEIRGPEAIKALVTTVRKAFPDTRYSLLGEPVVQGDRCSYRRTGGGTHSADFLGIAATGRYVTHIGTGTYRVCGGKIAELREDWDALGFLQQLGAAPMIGQITAAAGR